MPIRGVGTPAGGALGRDAELGRIEAWLAAGSGPAGPQLVLVIEGEPGIGKTTLWIEATGRARDAGWHVLSCLAGRLRCRAAPRRPGRPAAQRPR